MPDAIAGVVVKSLKLTANERGHLMEVQRRDERDFPGFGQAYVTQSFSGVVKAWYRHARQTDQIAAITGMAKLVLYDERPASPTHCVLQQVLMGELSPKLVLIPAGVWHGFKAIGETSAFFLHLNTEPFSFVDPDEERIAPDDPRIPYVW